MWKLFWHKEKNSKIVFVLYVATFIIYTLMLFAAKNEGFSSSSLFFIVWISFMVEAFRYSMFNLSYYFSNGADYSIMKPVVSQLRTCLKMLSIKTSDFILYNVIYTALRLAPFVLVTVLFGVAREQLYFITIFGIVYLLKAYIGPIHTMLLSTRIEIQLENRELPRKERKQEFMDQISILYPKMNPSIYKRMNTVFSISYLLIIFAMYSMVFPELFDRTNISSIDGIVVSAIGLVALLIYGIYINHLENVNEYELHKE